MKRGHRKSISASSPVVLLLDGGGCKPPGDPFEHITGKLDQLGLAPCWSSRTAASKCGSSWGCPATLGHTGVRLGRRDRKITQSDVVASGETTTAHSPTSSRCHAALEGGARLPNFRNVNPIPDACVLCNDQNISLPASRALVWLPSLIARSLGFTSSHPR